MSVLTPNMSLILPTVGVDPGPDYALFNNTDFTLLDSHDHSPGKGVALTPASLSISSDLSFLGNNATNLRAARFTSQASPITATSPDLNELYVSGVDLYYNDGNGNQIRVTQSGSVTGATGTITGLPSGTAGAAYSSISSTFIFSSATSVPAKIDAGDIIIRNLSTPTNAITLSAPVALPANYQLTLPASLPAGTRFLTVSNSGNVGDSYDVDNVTIEVASNLIRIKDNTPLTGNVTVSGDLSVGGTLTQPGGAGGMLPIQGTIDVSNNVLVGGGILQFNPTTIGVQLVGRSVNTIDIKDVIANSSHPIVVSANPSSAGLMIVRGLVNGTNGAVLTGEGWSGTRTGIGAYTITFTQPFADVPAVTASKTTVNNGPIAITSQTFGQFTADTFSDSTFNFIAIGQRIN